MESNIKPTINFASFNELQLSDYISVTDSLDDTYLYHVTYSKEIGFYLKGEKDELIYRLNISDSKLIASYMDGSKKVVVDSIKEITLSDYYLSKTSLCIGIEGFLLTYNYDMAKKYNLNKDMSQDYIIAEINKKTKK